MTETTDLSSMLPPGEQLRMKRIELGLEIEDIADELLLSVSQLQALENCDYDKLPGFTYIIGYWRSYAEFLDVDLSDSIDSFKARMNTPGSNIVLDPQHQKAHGHQEMSRRKSAAVFLVLSALFLGSVWIWQNPDTDLLSQSTSDQKDKSLTASPDREQQSDIKPDTEPEFLDDAKSIIALPEPNFAEHFQPVAPQTDLVQQSDEGLNAAADSANIESLQPINAVAGNDVYSILPTVSGEESDLTLNTADSAISDSMDEIVFTLARQAWLDVRDRSGEKLIYRMAATGEVVAVMGTPPFSVFIGAGTGVEVAFQGENVEFEPHVSGLYARFSLHADY